MGIQKQKWTGEEEAALKAGVDKHGPGKWKTILTDPDFKDALANRSNIDLKDKWRNLGIANIPLAWKKNDPVLAITGGSHATAQNTNNALSPVAANGATNTPRTPQDSGIMITRSMVLKAISSINDSKGSDFNAIASFMEQRHEVPYNFRRYLSSMIRRLTLQGRLEKVEQCYKIKNSGSSTKTPAPKARDVNPPAPKARDVNPPAPKARDVNPGTCENFDVSNPDTPGAAARSAAFWLVEAENKSILAAEAVEEAERVDVMLEECETTLKALKGFCKQYNL
ncbi:MYB transcription factor [Heracleum sosnowskyi]|uniref:MYB transcription factor n=1 Tax=Heracleum sosnowskyi TaxID=360622 RepID=A0AAD8MH95_9APIA|nr:MYB transcription factor [Heracleum sosnowskyi]